MPILTIASHRHLALKAEAADAAGAAADAAGAEGARLGGALADARAALAAAAADADAERAAAAAAAEKAAVEIDAWRVDAAGSADQKTSLARSLEAAEEALGGLRLEVREREGRWSGGRTSHRRFRSTTKKCLCVWSPAPVEYHIGGPVQRRSSVVCMESSSRRFNSERRKRWIGEEEERGDESREGVSDLAPATRRSGGSPL